MRTTNHLAHALLIILTLLLSMAQAVAQQESQNAATWYQQAINQYNSHVTEAQREALAEFLDHPDTVSPEVRALVSQSEGIFSLMQRGVAQEMSDTHLAYDQGFELLLPHLSPMRGIARMMSADAMIRMQDGDAAGSADRLAEMYRMSGHLGDDRVLISSLVGQAIFNLSDRFVQAGLDRGAFTPEQTASMIGALKNLGVEDPFNYVECIASEQALAVTSLDKAAADPEGIHKLASLLGADDNPELAMLDEQSYHTAVGQYDQMMDKVSEAFSSKDPEQAKAVLAQVSEDISAGLYGPLAKVLSPAFGKVMEKKIEASDKIAKRLELLEKFAGGQATIADVANAAVYYLRGIELLSRIDPARMQAVRDFASDPTANITDELADTLHRAEDALAQFRFGSTIKRCDFTSARRGQQLPLAPEYIAGMHDGQRLVQAEAVRLLRSGSGAQAAEWLATSLRMSGHLGLDPVIVSALTAQWDFNHTIALVQVSIESKSLDDAAIAVVADGLDRVSRRDPFGYVGALLAARKELTDGFTHRNPVDAEQQVRWQAAAEIVKQWNAAQILHYEVVADTLRPSSAAAEHGATAATTSPVVPLTALARLSDLLDPVQLDVVRADTARIAPLLAQDNWTFFAAGAPLPPLARPDGVMGRMSQARADVRKAMMLFTPDGNDKLEADQAEEKPK